MTGHLHIDRLASVQNVLSLITHFLGIAMQRGLYVIKSGSDTKDQQHLEGFSLILSALVPFVFNLSRVPNQGSVLVSLLYPPRLLQAHSQF